MCRGTGPGAESGAEAQWGILASWESRTVPAWDSRIRTTPAQQRPGAWAARPAADAREAWGGMREPACEGSLGVNQTDVVIAVALSLPNTSDAGTSWIVNSKVPNG